MRGRMPDRTTATVRLLLCALAAVTLAGCSHSSSLSNLAPSYSDTIHQLAGDSGPSLRFARAAREAGDLPTAIRLYRTLVADKSVAHAVRAELGDVLLAANLPDDAIDVFSQVPAGTAAHLVALLGLTKAHLALNEPAQALEYADQALAEAPRDERVLVDRGVALDSVGRRATSPHATISPCRWR
jgi:Flp pilus assembly protein TadD